MNDTDEIGVIMAVRLSPKTQVRGQCENCYETDTVLLDGATKKLCPSCTAWEYGDFDYVDCMEGDYILPFTVYCTDCNREISDQVFFDCFNDHRKNENDKYETY